MYLRPRHRRGAYPLAAEHTLPRSLRILLAGGAVLFAAYLIWTLFLRLLGFGGGLERAGAFLAVEERGTVSVSIDGKQQRAENGMMLFPEETVITGPGAHASLQFFDGSRARLDDGTELTITESSRGQRSSQLTLALEKGNIWLMTAGVRSFTGSIAWTITSPTLKFSITPGTEALLSPTRVLVFSSESEGISVTLAGHDPFLISEGQQWTLPASAQVGANIFDYRSPLDQAEARSAFVVESRALLSQASIGTRSSAPGNASTELLTLIEPQNGMVLTTPTVIVRGLVGAGVTRILVNGRPALLDTAKRTFSQEVSPPDGQAEFAITVQALDDARTVLAEVQRRITRAPAPPLSAPTITTPARAGDTYRTHAEELILRGGAPKGAVGIMVNDYKLQLFDPAKGEWSYVASLRLRNMVTGTNTYDVYALDAQGKKSPAARLTIIQGGEGADGVVSTASSAAVGSSAAGAGPLPQNAPLLPGTLLINLPEPGTTHTETGTGFLLIGSTSPKTASIWVNDYRLQLYKPGKESWNYIVDVAINNLKKGRNVYKVIARDGENQILDALTYTVEYQPK